MHIPSVWFGLVLNDGVGHCAGCAKGATSTGGEAAGQIYQLTFRATRCENMRSVMAV